MTKAYELPRQVGQLVWCPSDPTLGIGVVTAVESSQVRVRFLRLQEERQYTTRSAEPIIVRYQIAVGERVRNRGGEEHRVLKRLEAERKGLAIYELEDGEQIVESELIPEVRDIGAMERLATLTLAHPEVVRARIQGLELAKLGKRPGRAAVLGARVAWLPHQIDVACRAIERDPVRMLLADEVGLGKTVEAALIYAGLRHEGRARRVLILTPESLTIQWLGEIYRKTHELLVLLDDERIDDAEADMPGLGPFEAYQRIVASIDMIAKDPDLAAFCLKSEWDLVIIDEAHHLKWKGEKGKEGGNAAYKLALALSKKTRHMLLLTATPMALDPAEYHALLRLLDPTRFDDPSAFEAIAQRASIIRDVGRQVGAALEGGTLSKSVYADAVKVLEDDPDDLEVLERLFKTKPSAKDYKELAGRVLEALLHRHGLADYVVRNRRGPVGGLPQRKPQTIPLVPSEKQDQLIEVGEAVMFNLVSSMTGAERNATLGRLLRALWATPRALADILMQISPALVKELAPLIEKVTKAAPDAQGLPTGDARLRWLVQQLRGLTKGDKLLVFVETQVAVQALHAALEPYVGQNVAVFHRGLSARDQDRQVAWFRDANGPQVMLSTEAGGEGRNFQFCNKVVLYDLPWRPATIEQRIGRIDRVGQARDVHVLVPYFKSGYEAAILKVMQESIGVLDSTVGGIDHQLEYVSDRLAELVLQSAKGKGNIAELWKALYRETDKLVKEARERIENDVDVILDHASFSPQRAQAVLQTVPENLEEKLEELVQRFAEHNKVALKPKGNGLFAIEGAPGATGRTDDETNFIGTFSRTYALDHEDVEFLSFGHPLVAQALEWAREAHDASASLALARGFDREGAVFLWRYGIDLPDDVPQVATYFDDTAFTFALDEAGNRVPELEVLLESSTRPLDRMDPAPLRTSIQRWRRLVDQNYDSAQKFAESAADKAREAAAGRLLGSFAQRERDLRRSQARELQGVKPKSKQRRDLEAQHDLARRDLAEDKQRITTAIEGAMPRLQAVVAVRLMRAKQVSG